MPGAAAASSVARHSLCAFRSVLFRRGRTTQPASALTRTVTSAARQQTIVCAWFSSTPSAVPSKSKAKKKKQAMIMMEASGSSCSSSTTSSVPTPAACMTAANPSSNSISNPSPQKREVRKRNRLKKKLSKKTSLKKQPPDDPEELQRQRESEKKQRRLEKKQMQREKRIVEESRRQKHRRMVLGNVGSCSLVDWRWDPEREEYLRVDYRCRVQCCVAGDAEAGNGDFDPVVTDTETSLESHRRSGKRASSAYYAPLPFSMVSPPVFGWVAVKNHKGTMYYWNPSKNKIRWNEPML